MCVDITRFSRFPVDQDHFHLRIGDQYVTVVVETPKNLSSREKELFRELDELRSGKDGGSEDKKKSFFEKVKDALD